MPSRIKERIKKVEIKQHTTGGPKCPNHKVPLLSTGDRVKFQCPISTAIFDVELDDSDREIRYDKYGNPIVTYVFKSNSERS